jgi:hypothetical protein
VYLIFSYLLSLVTRYHALTAERRLEARLMEDLAGDEHHCDGNPLARRRTSVGTASSSANNGAAFRRSAMTWLRPNLTSHRRATRGTRSSPTPMTRSPKSIAMVFHPLQDETGGARMGVYGSTGRRRLDGNGG